MKQLRLDGGEVPLEQPAAAAAPADEPRPRRLVYLNTTDYARAEAHALDLERRGRGLVDQGLEHRDEITEAQSLYRRLMGVQGEIAAGRKLGIEAPLDPTAFRRRADIPPHWDVKTQETHSTDTQRGYLRLMPRSLIPGRRLVFVERDQHLDGSYVFVVHGLITTEHALEVGRHLYAYSPNLHVHVQHLEPIEPLCELDVEALERVAARWTFDGPPPPTAPCATCGKPLPADPTGESPYPWPTCLACSAQTPPAGP